VARVAAQERLITAAERLFAQRGIACVSLRKIGAAAEQRNVSAVQYHFGSKERLVEAIMAHRNQAIDRRRDGLLAHLNDAGDLRLLVEAMVYPFAKSVRPGSYYARFLAQAINDPVQDHLMPAGGPERDGGRRIAALMRKALPAMTTQVWTRRIHSAWRLLIQVLAAHERELEGGRPPPVTTPALATELVDMILGMISAPVPGGARAPQAIRSSRQPAPMNDRRSEATHVLTGRKRGVGHWSGAGSGSRHRGLKPDQERGI
jgi:AcrR family transcriptional regulator